MVLPKCKLRSSDCGLSPGRKPRVDWLENECGRGAANISPGVRRLARSSYGEKSPPRQNTAEWGTRRK